MKLEKQKYIWPTRNIDTIVQNKGFGAKFMNVRSGCRIFHWVSRLWCGWLSWSSLRSMADAERIIWSTVCIWYRLDDKTKSRLDRIGDEESLENKRILEETGIHNRCGINVSKKINMSVHKTKSFSANHVPGYQSLGMLDISKYSFKSGVNIFNRRILERIDCRLRMS